jgi:hypothetical protein
MAHERGNASADAKQSQVKKLFISGAFSKLHAWRKRLTGNRRHRRAAFTPLQRRQPGAQ